MDYFKQYLDLFGLLNISEGTYYSSEIQRGIENAIISNANKIGKVTNENFRDLIPTDGEILNIIKNRTGEIRREILKANALRPCLRCVDDEFFEDAAIVRRKVKRGSRQE
jgi:hypothetical protein